MQPVRTYIEDQQLVLPSTEDGVCKLGDLFDCKTGKGVGFNLFGKKLKKEHVSSSPISDTSYTLTHIQSSSDKMKSLEVSGNMSLEIMADLIKVEGSAAYDSSDMNSSHTETLSCDYRSDGFEIDLLLDARDAIDSHVNKMIMDKKLCATHIVKKVTIGGKLNAKISISKKDAKQKQGIKGSCFGKLAYGNINATVKADLKKLDSDESSCFNKQITIRSKPRITDPQPISIEDMFRVIANFPSTINQETHYTDWDAKVRGVPIKFTLVPIVLFLDHDVEKMYAQLEDDIFQRFKNLLINARDYSSPEYVERQIINRREDISILLMNKQSALSMEASTYAEELRCKANNVYQKAVSLLNGHRCGKVKPEETLQMLIDAEELVNPFEVIKKIENFTEAGQEDLTGMHYRDLCNSNSIRIFTDKANLTEWYSSEWGCKILLQTKGQPQEVFHKFDRLSQKLSELDFEVAVSVPSASQNFSLSIKLLEHAKEYLSNINYILEILKCAVTHGAGVEYEFFNLYSNIFRISLPIERKEIESVNQLIDHLDKYRNIYVANSSLDILTRLVNTSAELSFFIPIEAFETSFDAVSNLTGLNTKYPNVDWIVGPFLKNHLVAPMLLIFKGRSLMATCFDNVDLLFLDHIWSSRKKNDGSFDFSILSTENYQHTFRGDRLEYVTELLTTLNDTNTLGQLSEAQFWKSLNLTVNEYASDVIHLLQATAFHDQILFKQRLADVVLRKVPPMVIFNLRDVISRNENIPQLISALEDWCKQRSPIMSLIYEIDDLIKDYKSSEEVADIQRELISAVVRLIEHADCEQSIREIYDTWKIYNPKSLFSNIEVAIQSHIHAQANDNDQMWYVRKLIKSLTDCNATVQQDIMVSLCQRIELADDELKRIQDLIRDRIYRSAASAISKHKYGSNMNIFEAHMGKMNEIGNYQLLFDSVVKSRFIRSAELWRNAKFLYLVQENLKSESFLRSIVTFYNYVIPKYIPPEIRTVLNNMLPQEYKDDINVHTDFPIQKNGVINESIGTSESSKVIGIVKCKGPLEIRRALQLQRGFKSAEAGKSKWDQCDLLQETIHSFCNILWLPRNQRMKALLHLESEIFAMSNEQSKTLRNEILKQRNELRKIFLIEEQSTQIQNLRKSIKSNQNTLNDITLGLEHFYRELAQIYFINLSLRTQIQADIFIFIAPEKYAELLIDGHAIEILDGDACNLHKIWLMKIFHHVSIMKPNLKIFVVTILGLQSSGKSTLLNALFACRSAVSVGRCTRGLFARLLFLDNEIKNKFNIEADAIMLIDTEGLGAPEMMNDPDNIKKDRKLATFAMGISGLTIINMLGEYMTDLTDILQIAIIAMARLEVTGMSPDIMVVQHHLTERNADMVTTAIDSFNTALNNAITMTEKSDAKIGIRGAKCLQRMCSRLQSGEILKSFSPYKDGATANSPPSKQYQNDVVHLYKSILQVCQESGQIFELETWYELLRDFWSSVATENFAVNFKNLKEVQEFITHRYV